MVFTTDSVILFHDKLSYKRLIVRGLWKRVIFNEEKYIFRRLK